MRVKILKSEAGIDDKIEPDVEDVEVVDGLEPEMSTRVKCSEEKTFIAAEVEVRNEDYLINNFLLHDEELDLKKISTYYNENKIKLTFRFDDVDPSKREIIKINDISLEDTNAREKIEDLLKQLDELHEEIYDMAHNNLQADWDASPSSPAHIKNKPNVFTKEGGTIFGDVNIDGTLNMNVNGSNHSLTGLADPIGPTDAVNKQTLDSVIHEVTEQHYELNFVKDDFVFRNGYFVLTIPESEHGRGMNPKVEKFERKQHDDGEYFVGVEFEYRIMTNGNIKFSSNEAFDGRLILKNIIIK